MANTQINRRDFLRLIPAAAGYLGLSNLLTGCNIEKRNELGDMPLSRWNSKMLYNKPPLVLKSDRMIDVLGETTLADLPDPQPKHPARMKNATPIIERMWRIALRDVESNIVETDQGKYFGAGAIFGPKVFTRDISFAGVLGVNKLYPDLMRSSLEFTRNLRWDLGFKVIDYHKIDEIDVDWHLTGLGAEKFVNKYHTNCYSRRTDDVIWLWCAGDLIKDSTNKKDWKWLYDWGTKFFERFYDPFYDETDGLYRGQGCFMDVHSGPHKTTAYPHSWTTSDCVLVKATSTNCLYVKALQTMSQAAKKLGYKAQADQWSKKADKLKKAMCKELRYPDGTFAYYKDRWGKLAERKEALGTALTVLSEVVTGDDAVKALAGYPVTDVGIPTYDPFFGFERAYHDNTSWPFVVSLFFRALDKADGGDRTAQCLALVGRVCKNDGFREYIDMLDKSAKGSGSQLWCAAAFIDICIRAGLVEI